MANGTTTIELDFDGTRSISQMGNGGYRMTPVIAIKTVNTQYHQQRLAGRFFLAAVPSCRLPGVRLEYVRSANAHLRAPARPAARRALTVQFSWPNRAEAGSGCARLPTSAVRTAQALPSPHQPAASRSPLRLPVRHVFAPKSLEGTLRVGLKSYILLAVRPTVLPREARNGRCPKDLSAMSELWFQEH
jgi:hypothetical protein